MNPSAETALDTAQTTMARVVQGRVCRRCLRAGLPATVTDPEVDACPRCHSVLTGNQRARRHGLRSRPELHPETAAEFLTRYSRVLTDAGQGDAPVYTYASQARDFVRVELLVETSFTRIAEGGLRGKAIDQLLTLIATKARLAQQLGFERRSVPIHPLDAVRAAVEAANRS